MIENFEDADEAQSHAQSQKSASISYEVDRRYLPSQCYKTIYVCKIITILQFLYSGLRRNYFSTILDCA